MRPLAVKIVDGLLESDDLENFVQASVASDFGSFMQPTHRAGYDDGMGGDRDAYATVVESDDHQTKVTLSVSVLPEGKNPELLQVWFYITTKVTDWPALMQSWDMRLRSIKPEEIPAVAQQYFLWLTGAVPAIINTPRDKEASKHIHTRLKYQLTHQMWEFDRRAA